MLKFLCLHLELPPILLLASPSSGSPLCPWPFPLFSHSLSISLVSWRAESAQSRMAFSRLPPSLPPTSLWSGSSMTFTLPNPVADPYKWISTVPGWQRGLLCALPLSPNASDVGNLSFDLTYTLFCLL